MAFLHIQDLDVAVGGKALLQEVSLDVRPGQFTALLGPNGAGKSTLLKAVCGEIGHQSGQIQFLGRPMERWPRIELAQHLGVLPQHNSLSFPFRVREVVEMGLFPLSASASESRMIVNHALEQVDVYHLAERRYPTLSGGEKQRVQLARVLTQLAQASEPPLLLLDEPTSALDLSQQHRVLALAKALAKEQGFGVIAVLHDLNQAGRYADHLVVLDNGSIRYRGSANEVLTGDQVESVWHYRPTIVNDPKWGTPVVL
ncbi:iron complex transport system ATP-binding protein [Ferrimonas sediminum]|uniref:Iron complex transport system ATP-binding protein n=1 Tax=Ferrimonas sediminum TaxID=718193 RepID=A0A1G8NMI7_9GAMM|nr:heme ABC transporter ATP-binding protein [Ferrimonas sediminum]SDI81511.1 iron complex transport system ATP-binding protein [Ferrimonas sediminum]